MKRSIFNVLYIFALKPLFFEKNEIFKKLTKPIKGAVLNRWTFIKLPVFKYFDALITNIIVKIAN